MKSKSYFYELLSRLLQPSTIQSVSLLPAISASPDECARNENLGPFLILLHRISVDEGKESVFFEALQVILMYLKVLEKLL